MPITTSCSDPCWFFNNRTGTCGRTTHEAELWVTLQDGSCSWTGQSDIFPEVFLHPVTHVQVAFSFSSWTGDVSFRVVSCKLREFEWCFHIVLETLGWCRILLYIQGSILSKTVDFRIMVLEEWTQIETFQWRVMDEVFVLSLPLLQLSVFRTQSFTHVTPL